MDIRIKKGALLRGLTLAQGIADKRSTMPILANVLLRTDGQDKLLCGATDLTVSFSAELAAQVTQEGGITIPAKHLFDLIKSLPGDELTLKRLDNGWAEIRSGKIHYKLVAMPDRDFPRLPDPREVLFAKLEVAALRDLIAKTLFSASTDETRFHLNGVLFESDGNVARMISTDGHRLSKAERDLPAGPVLKSGVILPRKGLLELRRAFDLGGESCELGFHQGHAFVRLGEACLAIKLIDVQFPPYDQVIPKEHSRSAQVGRDVLLDALRRISLISQDRTSGVRLAFDKTSIRVESENPELGEAREELEASFEGEPLAIAFNARYLVELLGEMSSANVVLELGAELDPIVVRQGAGRYLGVVMPMRL